MYRPIVKYFGLVFSIFGVLLFISNRLFNNLYSNEFKTITIHLIVLIISIIFFISSFSRFGRYIHLICLSIASLYAYIFHCETGYGLVIIFFMALLSYKYGFLITHLYKKIFISSSVMILLLLLQLYKFGNKFTFLFPGMLFIGVFLLLAYSVLRCKVEIVNKREEYLQREIKRLTSDLNNKDLYLKSIGFDYIDPVESGLTEAELVLLENLCLYRESNVDLALRLGKSPNTVKVQLNKIMIKTGSENRYQLIDLCKNYYIKKSLVFT